MGNCGKIHRILDMWVLLQSMLPLMYQHWHGIRETRNLESNIVLCISKRRSQISYPWKVTSMGIGTHWYLEKMTKQKQEQTGKKWIKPGADCQKYRMDPEFGWARAFPLIDQAVLRFDCSSSWVLWLWISTNDKWSVLWRVFSRKGQDFLEKAILKVSFEVQTGVLWVK